MWQKGPGEGYMAAKADALALDPSLRCRVAYYTNGKRDGFVVETPAGKVVGTGRISRDAWGAALCALRVAADDTAEGRKEAMSNTDERMPPEVIEDKLTPGDWRVETVWAGRDGEVSVVMFSGPYAESEARTYHAWLLNNDNTQRTSRRTTATVLRLVRTVPPAPTPAPGGRE